MQIDKLFDELDARALDEVLTLPVRGTAEVSARRIRRRVNRTLDADPAARPGHLPPRQSSTCCAAGWMRIASAHWRSTPSSKRSRPTTCA